VRSGGYLVNKYKRIPSSLASLYQQFIQSTRAKIVSEHAAGRRKRSIGQDEVTTGAAHHGNKSGGAVYRASAFAFVRAVPFL
jgi:hypothetical protein